MGVIYGCAIYYRKMKQKLNNIEKQKIIINLIV